MTAVAANREPDDEAGIGDTAWSSDLPPGTLGDFFAETMIEHGSRPFLHWEECTWTYAEGFGLALSLARRLRDHYAVEPESRVGSFTTNQPFAVWLLLATQLSGQVYVPFNRGQRGQVLVDVISRSGVSILFADVEGYLYLQGLGVQDLVRLELLGDDPGGSVPADQALPGRSPESDARAAYDELRTHKSPGETALVLFTSGTTGRSKAVPLSHRQCVRGGIRVAESLGLRSADVFHGWVPLYHVSGIIDMTIPSMRAGGSVQLLPTFSRSRFFEQIRDAGASITLLFPSLFVAIFDDFTRTRQEAPPSLRAVVAGHIPRGLQEPFAKALEVGIYNVYGMTEAEPMALPRPGEQPPVGSCGRVSPDFEIAVLDDDDHMVPAGELGELAFRPRMPDMLTRGYEGDAEATLVSRRNLWFHTGDIGRVDEDGFVFVLDRKHNVLRVNGENVSAWEVEQVVRQHVGVADCVVLGIPNAIGEHDVKLVATLSDPGLSEPDLHDWVGARVAKFMVPRYIELRAELPYTDTGKVKTGELNSVENAWQAPKTR